MTHPSHNGQLGEAYQEALSFAVQSPGSRYSDTASCPGRTCPGLGSAESLLAKPRPRQPSHHHAGRQARASTNSCSSGAGWATRKQAASRASILPSPILNSLHFPGARRSRPDGGAQPRPRFSGLDSKAQPEGAGLGWGLSPSSPAVEGATCGQAVLVQTPRLLDGLRMSSSSSPLPTGGKRDQSLAELPAR